MCIRDRYSRARRLTNYQSPNDAILSYSNWKRLGLRNRVGRSGLPDDAPHRAVNVNCDRRVAATPRKDDDKSHSWYFDDEVFYQDLALTLGGKHDRWAMPTRHQEGGKLFLNIEPWVPGGTYFK
eukprot:TRINITY_DN2313_c0_g1_i1.p1 TRINITY_DN2313_c0_g1~~TRINITY_DN2313_c0_g1_i1.p1  ORF type:complete len:124 (+),score=21.02 TRINITY_DN2313_c0_g1_i1:128-499(+)